MNNVTKTPGVWEEKEGMVRGKTGEEREEDHSRWLGPGNKVAPFPDLLWLQFLMCCKRSQTGAGEGPGLGTRLGYKLMTVNHENLCEGYVTLEGSRLGNFCGKM